MSRVRDRFKRPDQRQTASLDHYYLPGTLTRKFLGHGKSMKILDFPLASTHEKFQKSNDHNLLVIKAFFAIVHIRSRCSWRFNTPPEVLFVISFYVEFRHFDRKPLIIFLKISQKFCFRI